MNFKSIILTTSFLSLTTIASADVSPIPGTNVFGAAGYFADNSTLSGTFSVAGGKISSVDLTVTQQFNGGSEVFTQIMNQSDEQNAGVNFWSANLTDKTGDTLLLDFVLPSHTFTLDGYTGGAICGTTAADKVSNCTASAATSYALKSNDPTLVSGQITAAPEPGSIGLIGAALSAMGLMLRRRFAKN